MIDINLTAMNFFLFQAEKKRRLTSSRHIVFRNDRSYEAGLSEFYVYDTSNPEPLTDYELPFSEVERIGRRQFERRRTV